MKKLIFDLTKTQPLGQIKFHGGGKYGEVVFKSLAKQTKDIVAYYDFAKWLNPEIEEVCRINGLIVVDSQHLSIADVADKYDAIVYSPIVEHNLDLINDNNIYITTIHGLRMLEYPTDRYINYYRSVNLKFLYKVYDFWKSKRTYTAELNRYRRLFAKKNCRFVTVSEHSKASILSFIPFFKGIDIQVFYSPSTVDDLDLDIHPYADEKYYLMVSADRWIKNTFRAIKAFDQIFSERPDFEGKVIITGLRDKKLFDEHIINKSRFVYLAYVDEKTLLSLYKGAYLFVYPTLNEGFGYPPIESMALGTPVIGSAISSIPEVCGDAILYFNPLIISEIKMRILQMEDQQIRQQYIDKMLRRLGEIKERQDSDLQRLTSYILSFLK